MFQFFLSYSYTYKDRCVSLCGYTVGLDENDAIDRLKREYNSESITVNNVSVDEVVDGIAVLEVS